MLSKWKIWDIFKSRPTIIDPERRVVCLQTFDPFVFSILKKSFDKSLFEGNQLHTLVGKDITSSWLDDNLKSLSLFGNNDSYLIHNAEDIKEDVYTSLLELNELLIDERYLVLSFTKDCSFLKKLKKLSHDKLEVIHVQPPAFWEDGELLDFFAKYFKVYLSFEAAQELKNKVKFEFQAYYQLFENLHLNFENVTEISKEQLTPYLSDYKVDQFELVELFGSKRFNQFYIKFIEILDSGNDMIQLLYFIQSHLAKVYDPSYLMSKRKLTKYDRQIDAQSKMWSKDELMRSINYFGELLTLAKKKDNNLEYKIKSGYLKTLRV